MGMLEKVQALLTITGQAGGGTAGAYVFRGSVATVADLPDEAEIGDVYNITSDGMNYAWTGTEWDALGATIDIEIDDALSETSTNPVQNKVIKTALDAKQDVLTAGENITITEDGEISAAGGGGGYEIIDSSIPYVLSGATALIKAMPTPSEELLGKRYVANDSRDVGPLKLYECQQTNNGYEWVLINDSLANVPLYDQTSRAFRILDPKVYDTSLSDMQSGVVITPAFHTTSGPDWVVAGVVAIGSGATVETRVGSYGNVAIGKGAIGCQEGVAIGYSATTTAGACCAVGQSAKAATGSVAMGHSANAAGYGVALGWQAKTSGQYSTALGHSSKAVANSTAIGFSASATAQNSIVIAGGTTKIVANATSLTYNGNEVAMAATVAALEERIAALEAQLAGATTEE